MIMPARATRCSATTTIAMARTFQICEKVLVEIMGFEPWPATIQSVVFNEVENNVNYHVKLDGSSKTVPMKKDNIKIMGVGDAERYKAMCPDELWHGARKRLEVIEGVYISMFSECGAPSSLWNQVPVDSKYEEVPNEDKAKLKLLRVAHNARVRFKELENKFALQAAQNKIELEKKNETDGYHHIFEKVGRKGSQVVIRFPCPMCSKKFKTRMALKKHMECTVDCTITKRTGLSVEQPKQCPKCFSLYKNEESLLKHMAVHEKILPKKKSGIRDYIRQIMSNNKACKVRSFSPVCTKSKASTNSAKLQSNPLRLPMRQVKKVVSTGDAEQEEAEEEDEGGEDTSTSETDSFKTAASKPCGVCSHAPCNCRPNKNLSRDNEAHSEREKERRRQMREAFENLADVLGVGNSSPKNIILQMAREEVQRLQEKEKRLGRSLADLRDMNVRLVTREYQLSC